MKPQFQHEATTSFALWLDHYLLLKGQSYTNKSSNLYYTEDETMVSYPEDDDGLIFYNSPYKQWVYNYDIPGADIPSGVYIDQGNGYEFCHRGHSGLMFDFDNGRIALEGSYFSSNYKDLKVKTDFAVKDTNIYLADADEENLIIENKYNINSRIFPELNEEVGLTPYDKVVPAAFVSMENTFNQPFAFGGEDLTKLFFRVVLFTENLYQLDGLMSICSDAHNLGVCNIGYDSHPLNEYGDTKNYYYSYTDNVKEFQEENKTTNLMFIESVSASKISERVSKINNPNLFLGFVDFELSQTRYPRSDIYDTPPSKDRPNPPPDFE